MRVAHITDIHLRSHLPGPASLGLRRCREMPGLLAGALEDARKREADVVALTGDLIDVPSYILDDPSCVAGCWLAAEDDYRLLSELLVASELPFVVVPGNHDAPELVGKVFGFGPYVRDLGPFRFVSFWDEEEHGSHIPRRVGRERRRFLDALGDPDPKPQIHLQHFVITPSLNDGYPYTYADGEELRRRIVTSGRVRLSLSGHFHAGTPVMPAGESAFVTGRAFTAWPHPYRIYDLDPTAGLVDMQEVELGEPRSVGRCVFVDWRCCVAPLSSDMDLLPGAAGALRVLQAAGFRLVVLGSPVAAGSGPTTPGLLDALGDRLAGLLAEEAVHLDGIYAEPAGDQASSVLGPAVFEQAARELTLDLTASYFLGERRVDTSGRRGAGVTPVLVGGGDEAGPSRLASDLGDAAERVLRGDS